MCIHINLSMHTYAYACAHVRTRARTLARSLARTLARAHTHIEGVRVCACVHPSTLHPTPYTLHPLHHARPPTP